MVDEIRDPFSILEVSPDAEADVIDASYRALVRRYRPEANASAGGPDPSEKMGDLYWAKAELDSDLEGWRDRIMARSATALSGSPRLDSDSQTAGSHSADRRAWIRDGGRAFHYYSPWVMAGLSFLTFGIYTFFWLNHWHGVMPKRRDDDPSTAKANWLLFIPLYGIYWMFVSLLRVCTRLDEELADAEVQQRVPKELVRWFCIFNLIPYVNYLVPPFLGSITTFQMQSRVNRLALLDEEYARSSGPADTRPPQSPRSTW